VNVWMREDGFIIDKLVIATDSSFAPAGLGPAESAPPATSTPHPPPPPPRPFDPSPPPAAAVVRRFHPGRRCQRHRLDGGGALHGEHRAGRAELARGRRRHRP